MRRAETQRSARSDCGTVSGIILDKTTFIDINTLKTICYWAGLSLFLVLEINLSYRKNSVSKPRRWMTNLPLSIINGSVYYFIYYSVIAEIMVRAESNQIGLLNSFFMPGWLKIIFGILILDFTLYVWHLLNHVVPLFWRFHRVHHSDMNMDVSTASRFHIGEILMSGLVRMMVVYSFGISFITYMLFEMMVNLSIQFHHSSIRINPVFEKIWILFFVPPSMHRVHHSVKITERDSNYGVLFSFWDRFLGTLTWGIDQSKILIGIGSHRKFKNLGFWYMWLMPFTRKSR
jgi:sterol desaturase/sphingolipid hydroxylase (fatty acid hydroxylase superfamily)